MTSLQTPSSTGRTATKPVNARSPSDVHLPDFTDPSFDPADFLNDTLPPLTLASSQPHASRPPGSVPLAELSARIQSLLSQINAQNVRLSSNLTQLTDEILRSSGRLAYEVEVLRGETIGLSDALTEVLHDDIRKFVPEGVDADTKEDGNGHPNVTRESADASEQPEENQGEPAEGRKIVAADPEYITKLRMLTQVRTRLEDVVHTFGEAMEWPLPPSEISLTSSFISVSAPEPGPDSHSREEKGQEMAKKLRTEVTELLDSNGGGQAGVEAAARRVEALRVLATVWKGSAEEKARNRFVDSLAKIVDDRRKALESQAKGREQHRSMTDSSHRSSSNKGRSSMDQNRDSDSGGPAGGLLRNLQRLRDEIYLE